MFQSQNKKTYNKRFVLFAFFSTYFIFFGVVNTVFSAGLYISPAVSNVSVGNIVSVQVLADSSGKEVNNSESVIEFPLDLLEVISISKNSSVFSLWPEEPKFSNTEGKITFIGGLPSPGFVGSSGNIISVTFRAKKIGSGSIVFSEAALRANDGFGTDILTIKNPGLINIGSAKDVPVPEVPPAKNTLPEKPVVTSDTHPNSEIWYSNNSATFSWKNPSGIKSVQASLNQSQVSTPTITYDNSVSQKTINDIADGKSYFHIRYANAQGYGPILHYKIQVDVTPPLPFTPKINKTGYQNEITLDAKDVTSGIEYYALKIDENPIIKVSNSSIVDGKYILPVQNKGEHKLTVVAYDKALNKTEAVINFESPIILAPTLSVKPENIKQDDKLIISGEIQYPSRDVEIFTQSGNDAPVLYKKNTSDTGAFTIITDQIKQSGNLSVWGRVSLSDTVKGEESSKIYVNVRKLEISESAAKIIRILLIVIPILLLLILILLAIYSGWHKFFGLKRKINSESKSAIDDIHKLMISLKEELGKRLIEIEDIKIDRKLNKKEQDIFKKIQGKVGDIDEFIEKKLSKFKE